MGNPHEPDSIKPALRRAEAELAEHLGEACEDLDDKDLSQESMDELLRLENELLAAARAAQKAVQLRRQLGDRSEAENRESLGSPGAPPGSAPEQTPVCRMREFCDETGAEWRVWEVKPGSTGRATNPARYLGDYVNGWLAFESGNIRRRLAGFPADWLTFPDVDLGLLIPRAVEVSARKHGPGAAPAP